MFSLSAECSWPDNKLCCRCWLRAEIGCLGMHFAPVAGIDVMEAKCQKETVKVCAKGFRSAPGRGGDTMCAKGFRSSPGRGGDTMCAKGFRSAPGRGGDTM